MTDKLLAEFFVEGIPRPKQSFRYSRKGNYQPARLVEWEGAVRDEALHHRRSEIPNMISFIRVCLTFYLPDRRKRDLDNLSKGVLDALKGIIYWDDVQVTDLYLQKRQVTKDQPPGVQVRVETAEPAETITDGWNVFPAHCPDCGAKMQIIRPGDARCSAECDRKDETK